MSGRLLYVYRLVVTIPDECLVPGFVPDVLRDRETYRDWDSSPFRWPRRRHYLDWSAASRRAWMLREWGAHVRVERALVDYWHPVGMWWETEEETPC